MDGLLHAISYASSYLNTDEVVYLKWALVIAPLTSLRHEFTHTFLKKDWAAIDMD